jgi:Bacterial pre-peptidase C-terminal domain/PEP-CTERM motif
MKIGKWTLRAGLAVLATAMATGQASAGVVLEVEGNDSIATAQSINGSFTLDASPDIGDITGANTSTSIPHVTVRGLPGDGTRDFYSFNVSSAGILGIFDIDYALNAPGRPSGFDAWLNLFDSSGTILAQSDDGGTTAGAGGSFHPYDSFIQYTFANAGTYFIQVGNFPNQPQSGGSGYDLQVSVAQHALGGAVPEPATWAMMLAGFGLVGAAMRRRKTAGAIALA